MGTTAKMAEWIQPVSFLLMCMVYIGECSLDFVSECAIKGYTNNLLCSTCDMMEDFQLGPAIRDDCLQCCQKDQEEPGVTKYPYAELVVCN